MINKVLSVSPSQFYFPPGSADLLQGKYQASLWSQKPLIQHRSITCRYEYPLYQLEVKSQKITAKDGTRRVSTVLYLDFLPLTAVSLKISSH